MIFNFSHHVLNTTTENSILSNGLNFVIPPKNISYADFMVLFELVYRDVNSLEVSNLDKEFIKSRLRDSAFFIIEGPPVKLLRRTCSKSNLMH